MVCRYFSREFYMVKKYHYSVNAVILRVIKSLFLHFPLQKNMIPGYDTELCITSFQSIKRITFKNLKRVTKLLHCYNILKIHNIFLFWMINIYAIIHYNFVLKGYIIISESFRSKCLLLTPWKRALIMAWCFVKSNKHLWKNVNCLHEENILIYEFVFI